MRHLDPRVRRVMGYFARDPAIDLAATEAARLVGVETTYFCHLFVEQVGLRFTCWKRHVRVHLARALLRDSDDSVLDIAMTVGFGDVRTLQRAMREVLGVTPSACRRSDRQAGGTQEPT